MSLTVKLPCCKVILIITTNLNPKGKQMSTSNSKRPLFTKRICVRLSSADYEHAKIQANCVGVSLSRYARELITGTTIQASADAAVLRELRRQGGLVKLALSEGADSVT